MGEGENPYTLGSLIHPELPISLPGRWRFREGTGFHRSHSSDRPSETRAELPWVLGAGVHLGPGSWTCSSVQWATCVGY